MNIKRLSKFSGSRQAVLFVSFVLSLLPLFAHYFSELERSWRRARRNLDTSTTLNVNLYLIDRIAHTFVSRPTPARGVSQNMHNCNYLQPNGIGYLKAFHCYEAFRQGNVSQAKGPIPEYSVTNLHKVQTHCIAFV